MGEPTRAHNKHENVARSPMAQWEPPRHERTTALDNSMELTADQAAREQLAAQTIQNLVRRYFAIQSANQLRAQRDGAVLKIQAGFRGMKARKQADYQRFLRCIDDYDKTRMVRAIVLIQSACKRDIQLSMD